MSRKISLFSCLLLAGLLLCTTNSSAQQSPTDISGVWSGTFFSKHPNVAPFTLTVVITPKGKAHFIGDTSLNSECLKRAKLEITVSGETVVLAGSDQQGDNMSVRGTLDNTGTMLNSSYVLNGSATGQCETDDGTGTLAKR